MATPTADISTFTEEQKKLFQDAAALGSGVQVIDSTNLAPTTPLTLPEVPQTNPQELQATTAGIPSIQDIYNQIYGTQSKEQATQDELRQQILTSLGIVSGKAGRERELEAGAGIPDLQKEIQGLSSQLTSLKYEAAAIPLQIQEEFTGRGATIGGVEPIQNARLRQNAIKALTTSAIAQTKLGQLDIAQQQVARAIELEFEPEERRLQFLQQAYTFNREDLERIDRKRADVLNLMLGERSRLLEIEKANKDEIYTIGLTAQKYGADAGTIQKIFRARNREEAVSFAGQFLTNPQAKYELESARLDNILKRTQIEKAQRELQLLREPKKEEIEAQIKALKEALAAVPVMKDKIATVDALLGHSGLNTRVGTGFTSRGPQGIFGTIGRLVSVVGIPSLIGGAIDKATGAGQDFAGGVHQLVSGLTLDNLIAAKARGATFGALSEGELGVLANSATKISDWEIKDNGVGTGFWNIDESSFKKELQTIQNLTQRALTLSQGQILSDDEQAILDALGEIGGFNPAF